MSAQQTSYSLETAIPNQPGHVADSHPKRIRPFRNDNSGSMPFGLAVCRSANTDLRGFDACGVARQLLGVTTWGQSQEAGYPVGTALNGIATTEMNGILEQGEILVSVVEAVTPESPVRVFIVDYSGTVPGAVAGAFGTTLSATHTALMANAKYITSTTAAGVVKVLLNSPGPAKLVSD